MKHMLTPEQRYWTLNGNFEALSKILKALKNGDISDSIELKNYLVSNMKVINELMSKFEGPETLN